MTISNISSKATGPVVTKFRVEPPGAEGTKICLNRLGYMIKIATMPKNGKSLRPLTQDSHSMTISNISSNMVKVYKSLQLPN